MVKTNIFWYSLNKNVGDLVGPYIASKILNKPLPLISSPNNNSSISLCGSILCVGQNRINWGTGILCKSHIPNQRIKAVRGPLTRECCIRSGYKPNINKGINIFGDPGLLVSKYYKGKKNNGYKYKLGIIPHYIDKNHLLFILPKNYEDYGITILNVQQDVEKFVDDMLECETTISSSLHGLILSISYGIPTRWVKLGNRLAGDDIKFFDFFLSLRYPSLTEDNIKEEYNLYIQNMMKYINKVIDINKLKNLGIYDNIKNYFCINLNAKIDIDNMLKYPVKYEIPDNMLNTLLEVFPSEDIIIQ